jgi:serine/threonine-protein kinase HipA
MPAERHTIEVWGDWAALGGALRIGSLHATPSRGRQLLSFEYDEQWLARGSIVSLDPALQPVRGPQFAGNGRESFGVFLDSAPDRWGRTSRARPRTALATDRLLRAGLERG